MGRGKRQILPYLISMIPRKFRTYYEPFVGGGALLVKLYSMNMLNEAVISDLNTDLIDLYIL